ncbi:MAG: T9SS type A sorting domain-containing protein [Flavobacterium sp.]|nr:T9SS type A sorting domain-containing protein [Flavobacterium sp.]
MKNFLVVLCMLSFNATFSQTDWVQKNDFGGTARWSAISASIGTKGYIGLGQDENGRKNDFWEWDQLTNTWTQKANFPSTGRLGAIGFSIGNKIYVGTGYDGAGGINYKNDFWEWDQSTDTWTQKANIPIGRAEGVGFSIGTKGYMLTGSSNTNIAGSNDLWEWDQATDTWTQKANIPAEGTFLASGFSIGSKGYVLMGVASFWEWDQLTDVWTQKASIGASSADRAADFSVNNKGYIGGVGQNDDEFWEYSPNTDSWKHLENIPSGRRGIPTGFSIGNLAYIGTGFDEPFKKDFWEADPTNLCSHALITAQPAVQTANLFGDATFSIAATGSNLTYQWQSDIGNGFENIIDNDQYSGALTNTLIISNLLASNNDQWFRCIVSSGFCDLASGSALLAVACIPLIDVQPSNQSVSIGDNAEFSVQSSYPNVNYQWQGNFGIGFQNLSNAGQYFGATDATLTISSVTTSNNNQLFRCLVSSGACVDQSSEVILSTVLNTNDVTEKIEDRCSIFPNPTKESINVRVSMDLIGSNYSIYDQLGKEIYFGKLISETTAIDICLFPSGIYFFRLKDKSDFILKISKL